MLKILFVCSLLLFTSYSFALSKEGHQVVCQLAFEHLSPFKQQQVVYLLNNIASPDKKAINHYNNKQANSAISFSDACTWPDAIKTRAEYAKYKSWHYVNVARDTRRLNSSTCLTDCLPRAILYHQRKITQKSNTKEKIKDLMFLGHWLGDIHQPLHVSFADDAGGNRVKISGATGGCSNLHALWDRCLLKGNNSQTVKKLVDKLNTQWPYMPSGRWSDDSVWTWANESFSLAKQPSFLYCKMDSNGYCHKSSEAELSLSYYEKYQPIMEQRLLKAAIRLSYLLEQSL
jgi:hypothetical protein